MATMIDTPKAALSGQSAGNPVVWAIDSATADRYGLVTITGKTSLGAFSAVPCVIVSGTHQVREWRVWSKMRQPDESVKMENVGFVEIDPVSVPAAVRFRVRTSYLCEWSDTVLYTLHAACTLLQYSRKMGIKVCEPIEAHVRLAEMFGYGTA